MPVEYVSAKLSDIDRLVETRVEVLRAANRLDGGADMAEVARQSREYYAQALADGSHAACFALDGARVVGTGGVSFYRVMPTWHNPTGRKAYIMNMYVTPAYRRRGVARGMLRRLVDAARDRGITAIGLEATDMGRPLYEAFGFVPAGREMELP